MCTKYRGCVNECIETETYTFSSHTRKISRRSHYQQYCDIKPPPVEHQVFTVQFAGNACSKFHRLPLKTTARRKNTLWKLPFPHELATCDRTFLSFSANCLRQLQSIANLRWLSTFFDYALRSFFELCTDARLSAAEKIST